MYQHSPTAWFNQQLSSLGPALTGQQPQDLVDLLTQPRFAAGQAIEDLPTGNLPVVSGAADIAKTVAGEFLKSPGLIDAPKTIQDLQNKYSQGVQFDDQGKLQITPTDISQWAPEDQQAYHQATLAMMGVETPELPGLAKTGTRILNEAGDLLATNKAPMSTIFERASGEGQLQRALDSLSAYPDEVAGPIRSFVEGQAGQAPASDIAATVLKFLKRTGRQSRIRRHP